MSFPRLPETVLSGFETSFRKREKRRDRLVEEGRCTRRLAQAIMCRVHAGEEIPPSAGKKLCLSLHHLNQWLKGPALMDAPLVFDARQEAVESLLLLAVVSRRPFPSPDQLRVDPEIYLSALADLVGEIRRLALRALGHESYPEAEEYLTLMEQIGQDLLRFDTPRSILSMKPLQDRTRGLIERTRGEVTLARLLSRARLPISSHGGEELP